MYLIVNIVLLCSPIFSQALLFRPHLLVQREENERDKVKWAKIAAKLGRGNYC